MEPPQAEGAEHERGGIGYESIVWWWRPLSLQFWWRCWWLAQLEYDYGHEYVCRQARAWMIANGLAALGVAGRVMLGIHIEGSWYRRMFFFLAGGLTDRLANKPYQQKIPGGSG